MSGRRSIALALAALTGVASAVVVVLVQRSAGDRLDEGAAAVGELAFLVVGILILAWHPRHRVGRLLVAGPLIALVGTAVLELAVPRLGHHPHDVTAQVAATLGSLGRGAGWMLDVLLLPLLFPDGQPSGPRRLRQAAWSASSGAIVAFVGVTVLSPTQTDLRIDRVDNPLGLPHSWAGVADALSMLLLVGSVVGIVLGMATVVSRFRHGSDLRRQQVLWFALSFAPPIALFVLSVVDLAQTWMFGLSTLPVAVAILVAIRQRRLYDVQLVVNRSLTYASLWLAIAVLYAIVVGGVGATVRDEGAGWLPWVAAGVVAVSFAPMRDALQRGANRLTYGQWSQPAAVLAATSKRLEDATDVPGLLQDLVVEVGDLLDLEYVEITDPAGSSLARRGLPPAQVDTLPMTSYGAVVGELAWARRPLRDADRALLGDLARQLGGVVHAAAMLDALRASQERLVVAREEERRRLRRDLHDGLGPALAGLSLKVDTVRNQVGEPTVDAGLLDLRAGIRDTVLDVRRIVEGLRPAALDDLGLEESVRQLVTGLRTPTCLDVDALPRLPAAVELAAYRIVQEALTNVDRHSAASTARVQLSALPDRLHVVVADDGHGDVAPRAAGVGLGSMRERAEEIGGVFTLTAAPGHGTTIEASLPLTGRASS